MGKNEDYYKPSSNQLKVSIKMCLCLCVWHFWQLLTLTTKSFWLGIVHCSRQSPSNIHINIVQSMRHWNDWTRELWMCLFCRCVFMTDMWVPLGLDKNFVPHLQHCQNTTPKHDKKTETLKSWSNSQFIFMTFNV